MKDHVVYCVSITTGEQVTFKGIDGTPFLYSKNDAEREAATLTRNFACKWSTFGSRNFDLRGHNHVLQ